MVVGEWSEKTISSVRRYTKYAFRVFSRLLTSSHKTIHKSVFGGAGITKIAGSRSAFHPSLQDSSNREGSGD